MPDDYEATQGPNGAVVLLPRGEEGLPRARVLMAGELVSRMTVLEIMNMVTSAQWNGSLFVCGPGATRELTITQGALKHARTDVESERIGELLIQAGLLTRSDLIRLLPQKRSSERFGQLLVREGLLREDALFTQLQRQTESIFYAAMLVEHGWYWFVTASESGEVPATVHLPVQGLLMEGVQRIDEMALFRERIPHNLFFPVASADARPAQLDAKGEAVLAIADGSRSIDDLNRATGLGEFITLKTVYGLLRGGQVKLRRGPTLDVTAARRMVRQFNEVIRDVFVAVGTYGSMARTSEALCSWLANGPHGPRIGVSVDIDGTLGVAEVLARIESASGGEDVLQELHQALQELALYALFLASNVLPPQEQRTLARHVDHRLGLLLL